MATVSYLDENLHHNLVMGRYITRVVHLINKTPIDWFSKRQSTVETSAHGSEYSSPRACTEQILDLLITLRYLSATLCKRSCMFRDNKSMVNSSMTSHGKFHKRYVALSFHSVREAIAAKVV